MILFIQYFERLFFTLLFFCLLVQCSDHAKPKMAGSDELSEQIEKTDPDLILDEIPEHIKEVENVTIFPGDSEPLYSIELIHEQTFGKTGNPYLVNVLNSVVDDRGKVIIHSADANYQQVLHVFNADGTYHTQLGRQGRGPGEYGTIVGMHAKAGKVFVLDYNSQRLNEYSTKDYSYLRSILLEQWSKDDKFRFGYVEPRNDGNYLITLSDERSTYGRLEIKFQVMDYEGNAMQEEPLLFQDGFRIKVGQSMKPTMPLTFLGKTTVALSHEDMLYTAWTRDFLIKKYDANGQYKSAIYYPIKGAAFDLDDYIESQFFSPKKRDIEEAFAEMNQELPETFPVINSIKVDDENRIWVAVPIGAKNEHYVWWVLDNTGQLLAKLLLSQDQRIHDIKNGYLYSKEIDEETKAEYVVKYRIELKEK